MRAATWLIGRLVGTPAAQAIVGDLVESAGGHGSLWRSSEAWRVVFSLMSYQLRRSGQEDQGAPGPLRPRPGMPEHSGSSALQDVRFALRIFRRRPVSTAVAILSLALGIGANTAIFSLLDGILLRPLPVPRPEELVTTATVFSFPDYEDLRDASTDELTGLAAWSASSRPYSLATDNGAWPALTELTTGNFFDLLEFRPAAGRFLTLDDESRRLPVAVLSHRLWQSAFYGDPLVIGSDVRVNGLPATIIGVAPPGFRGTRVNRSVDLWMPLSLHAQLAPGSFGRLRLDSRETQWLRVMGRLRPNTGLAQAEASMLAAATRLLEQQPSPYLEDFESLRTATQAAIPREEEVRGFLTLMIAMVAVALLVACTNVANVLLTRTTERRREIGLRMVLGASRGRLVRQLFIESLLLSLAGGVAALFFARWTLASVHLLQIPGRIVLGDVPTSINATTLAFTMAVAFACSLLFGVGPALAGTRPDPARMINGSAPRRGNWNAPVTLATIQVGLTLALVFSGGLFLRSLSTVLEVPLGFDPTDVYVASVDIGVVGYDNDSAATFRREALAGLESLPTIERAAWGVFVPVQGGMRMESFRVVGHELQEEEPGDVALNYVSDGFFEALRVPLLAGRAFAATDREGTAPVTIVNEALADIFFPSGDTVGARLIMPGPAGILEMEIIGVAGNTKRRDLREESSPYLYLPLAQWNWLVGTDRMKIAVRATPGAADTIDSMRQRLAQIDPALPITELRTLDDQLFDQAMPQRVGATLLGMFGALALVLAAVGVYGVVAAAMLSRVREIGIRRAVGANDPDVLRLVLRRGLLPVVLGLPLGWFLAFAVARLIAGFLPGLSPTDPTTFVAATVLVFVASAVACLPPALRAARRDPVTALRSD